MFAPLDQIRFLTHYVFSGNVTREIFVFPHKRNGFRLSRMPSSLYEKNVLTVNICNSKKKLNKNGLIGPKTKGNVQLWYEHKYRSETVKQKEEYTAKTTENR